jgi:hypothetical protein
LVIPFKRDYLSTIGGTCAFDAKKVLDTRFSMLITRCGKRSKRIFRLAVFDIEVPAVLIEMRIACSVQRIGEEKLTTNEHRLARIY